MSPHHAVHFQEAIRAFEVMAGWAGGEFPIRLGGWAGDEILWRPRGGDIPDLVQWLDERHDDEILIGLPRTRRWVAMPGDREVAAAVPSTVLWAVVDGKEQLQKAQRFKPRPTMVLSAGAGSKRVLLWWLEQPLNHSLAVKANRRIAYRLGAVQKHSDPDTFWINAPGTCLREKRARPVPVVVSRLTIASYWAGQVVGRLKDPPEFDWREKAGAVRARG